MEEQKTPETPEQRHDREAMERRTDQIEGYFEGEDTPHSSHARAQSESARRRLIAAARQEFATRGYEAATVRNITGQAGVNLGAVNYHFQSKEMLYHAVLYDMVGPLHHRVRWAAHAPVPALEKVERIVRAIFEHIGKNPDMPAVMVRELASGREIAGPIREVFGDVLPLLAGVIADGQRDGTIREGDPILLSLSTVAQPVYLNIARPVITKVAGVEPQDARVVEHAVLVVRAALEKRP